MNRTYEIRDRKSLLELEAQLHKLYKKYEGKVYKHRNGEEYIVVDSTIINVNGSSFYGLVYCPFEGGAIFSRVRHARCLQEFLDGRFVEVTE